MDTFILSRQQFTTMASLTSEFLNFIVFRYLFESGNLILIFRTCYIYPILIDVFLLWNSHESEFENWILYLHKVGI